MSSLVQVAVAGDVTEAEELQDLLEAAGIPTELRPAEEADAIDVFVPEDRLDQAKDAIEALTEPDDVVADA
jgi:hypothetical protein